MRVSRKRQSPLSTAAALSELERWYRIFNAQLLDGKLSDRVVITIQSMGRHRRSLGWHSPKRWTGTRRRTMSEINVVAEALRRPAEEVLETLLHEMAHKFNEERGIQDVTSAQQYHNKRFKEAAELAGLVVQQVPKFGFALTSLGPRAKEVIHGHRPDRKAFLLSRVAEGPGIPKAPTKLAKWVCECGYGVRVAKKDFNATCDDCGEQFQQAG